VRAAPLGGSVWLGPANIVASASGRIAGKCCPRAVEPPDRERIDYAQFQMFRCDFVGEFPQPQQRFTTTIRPLFTSAPAPHVSMRGSNATCRVIRIVRQLAKPSLGGLRVCSRP
jgi:hypothetical protein